MYQCSKYTLILILSIITITISYHPLHSSVTSKHSIYSRRLSLYNNEYPSSLFKYTDINHKEQSQRLYLHTNDITSDQFHSKKLKHFISIFLINIQLFLSINFNINIQPSYATTSTIIDDKSIETIATTTTDDNKYPIFNEVWNLANDHFFDNTYNNHDWKQIKIDYLNRLNNGADEEKIVENMLSLLGSIFVTILKYNNIIYMIYNNI